MRNRPLFAQPPRIAVWLIMLFAAGETGETMLGDLLEEFSAIASHSGNGFARRWFWRQTAKTIPHLFVAAFRVKPWKTFAAVASGFLLRKLVARLPEPAIFWLVDRFQIYDRHFEIYRFMASTAIDIAHLATFFLIGLVVALAARDREIPATAALGFLYAAMAVSGCIVMATRGHFDWLPRMTWYLSDSLVIVVAGAMVRASRLRMALRSSTA
jgi:hypothetical protein